MPYERGVKPMAYSGKIVFMFGLATDTLYQTTRTGEFDVFWWCVNDSDRASPNPDPELVPSSCHFPDPDPLLL